MIKGLDQNSYQDDLISRLNRISGQVKGISTMILEGKECNLVMTQIMAARSGLAKVASKLLTRQSCKMSLANNQNDLEKLINQLANLK